MTLPAIHNPFDKKLSLRTFNAKRDEFLRSFGNNNIFCHNADPTKKISQMKHRIGLTLIMDELHQNHKGSDIYFYVNCCRKMNEVRNFRACFCDLDAGRDSSGKYLEYKQVRSKKQKFLQQIRDFAVKPSWVVETRNGYQCYWILSNSIFIHRANWSGLQKKLANHFGADVLAIKPNQIMRVPYTYWNKKWEGKAPFFCHIVSGDGTKVSSQQLQNALEGVSALTDKSRINQSSEHWFNKRSYVVNANFYPESHEHTPTQLVTCSTSIDSSTQNKFALKLIDFLNQSAKALYFSDNKFLSGCAKELAQEVSDRFCVG